MGTQLETVCVIDWASVLRNSARQVSRNHLVNGVASEHRKNVGDGVLRAIEVLDFDRLFH